MLKVMEEVKDTPADNTHLVAMHRPTGAACLHQLGKLLTIFTTLALTQDSN